MADRDSSDKQNYKEILKDVEGLDDIPEAFHEEIAKQLEHVRNNLDTFDNLKSSGMLDSFKELKSSDEEQTSSTIWEQVNEKSHACQKIADNAGRRTHVPLKYTSAKNKVDSILNLFKSLKKELPKIMHPDLYNEMKLGEFGSEILEILSLIEAQGVTPSSARSKDVAMPQPYIKIVNKTVDVSSMMYAISDALDGNSGALLAVDLEAVDLCRDGDVSIVQIYLEATNTIFIIDVFELQGAAFSTPSYSHSNPLTLKTILEARDIKKLFYDCRADNDALSHLYDVKMDGVIDLQLMEYATRHERLDRVFGLDMAVTARCDLSEQDKEKWRSAKTWGNRALKCGPQETQKLHESREGDYRSLEFKSSLLKKQFPDPGNIQWENRNLKAELAAVTNYKHAGHRPLHVLVIQYCVHDVVLLPQLYRHLLEHRLWSKDWDERVRDETDNRLQRSRGPEYSCHGEGKSAPEGWEEIKKAEGKRQVEADQDDKV